MFGRGTIARACSNHEAAAARSNESARTPSDAERRRHITVAGVQRCLRPLQRTEPPRSSSSRARRRRRPARMRQRDHAQDDVPRNQELGINTSGSRVIGLSVLHCSCWETAAARRTNGDDGDDDIQNPWDVEVTDSGRSEYARRRRNPSRGSSMMRSKLTWRPTHSQGVRRRA